MIEQAQADQAKAASEAVKVQTKIDAAYAKVAVKEKDLLTKARTKEQTAAASIQQATDTLLVTTLPRGVGNRGTRLIPAPKSVGYVATILPLGPHMLIDSHDAV